MIAEVIALGLLGRCPRIAAIAAITAMTAISICVITRVDMAFADDAAAQDSAEVTVDKRSLIEDSLGNPGADTQELSDWADSLRVFVRELYGRKLPGPRRYRIVDVTIQTTGDFSQLDSLGVDTTWWYISRRVNARIRAALIPAIRALPSVVYVYRVSTRRDIYPNLIDPDQERMMGRRDVSEEWVYKPRIPTSTGVVVVQVDVPEEFLAGHMIVRAMVQDTVKPGKGVLKGLPVNCPAIFIGNDVFMVDNMRPGVYDLTVSSEEALLKIARDSVNGLGASPLCDEITVEGVRVELGMASLMRLDFMGTAVTGNERATDTDTCRVQWQELFEPMVLHDN